MNNETTRLLEIVGLAKSYCELCETTHDYTKEEFINQALNLLPRIYWNFFDLTAGVSLEEGDYFSDYLEESQYNYVQNSIASLLGESDMFLETFEEDMKYSDTPISSSISECMADIYQPLFNFVSIVHDSEGTQMEEAYIKCKEDFEEYWSQTLCNALKALNNVKYSTISEY